MYLLGRGADFSTLWELQGLSERPNLAAHHSRDVRCSVSRGRPLVSRDGLNLRAFCVWNWGTIAIREPFQHIDNFWFVHGLRGLREKVREMTPIWVSQFKHYYSRLVIVIMDMRPTYHHALDGPSWSNSHHLVRANEPTPQSSTPLDGASEEGQRMPWCLLPRLWWCFSV